MGGVIRVVLVDDDPLVRSALTLMLGGQPDLEVVGEAGDGREGVALIERLRPDVVLMDIRMPELDGVEATRQVFSPARVARREQEGRGPVRVVVLTTFDLDDMQCLLPAILCSATNGCEVQLRLLGREVQQGILFADE